MNRRRTNALIVFAAAIAAVAAAVVLWAIAGRTSVSPAAQRAAAPPRRATEQAQQAAPRIDDPQQASAQSEQIVDDSEGQLLWASPTEGKPPSLDFLPGATGCVLFVRPANLMRCSGGRSAVEALGPWGQAKVHELELIAGRPVAGIEQLALSLFVGTDDVLSVVLRMRLATELSAEDFSERFPGAERGRRGAFVVFALAERAYILDEGRRTLVVCGADQAAELIEAVGEPPAVSREMERALQSLDADRMASLTFAPRFFRAGGHAALIGEALPMRDYVERRFDGCGSLTLSMHWDERFFVELRAAPQLNVLPAAMALRLRQAVDASSQEASAALAKYSPSDYSRELLTLLPAMLRSASQHSRVSVDRRDAVARCYLPAAAGHNLLLAGELLLAELDRRTQSPPTASATKQLDSPTAADVERRLQRTTSLVFPKDSLQRALELLAEDLGVPIRLAGGDLQLDGITKNQSLSLDLRDQAAGRILVEILLRANPDRGATGPADPRQKLVYVIAPGAGDSAEILVTTRSAADRRGDRLPDVFVGGAP